MATQNPILDRIPSKLQQLNFFIMNTEKSNFGCV